MNDRERFIDSVTKYIGLPGVIVDVGARWGVDAIAFKAAFPDAQVFAIDPMNLNMKACLEGGVTPVVAACAAIWGCSPFHLEDDGALDSLYRRGRSPIGAIAVATLPLDCILTSADAIKIDVEGAAWDVLRGAHNVLETARLVQLETETEAFFSGQHLEEECFFLLENAGFKKVWEERCPITDTGHQTESVWVRQ